MRIVWSPLAIDQAEGMARYIEERRPIAASKWIDQLFREVDKLRQFPRSGRMVPGIDRDQYRELIFDAVRVVYRVESKRVKILTLRHQRLELTPFSGHLPFVGERSPDVEETLPTGIHSTSRRASSIGAQYPGARQRV